jgi:Tfp pilus assembly protein PilF
LLRWLRLELESRAFAAAGQLLKAHARDFGRAKLQAEAAWLGVSLLREQGKAEAARAAARDLMRRFPGTPQADAASGYLGAP